MGVFPNRARAVKAIPRVRKRIPIKNGMVGIWEMLKILATAMETRKIGYDQMVDYGVCRWVEAKVFVTKSRLRDIGRGPKPAIPVRAMAPGRNTEDSEGFMKRRSVAPKTTCCENGPPPTTLKATEKMK